MKAARFPPTVRSTSRPKTARFKSRSIRTTIRTNRKLNVAPVLIRGTTLNSTPSLDALLPAVEGLSFLHVLDTPLFRAATVRERYQVSRNAALDSFYRFPLDSIL